MADPTGPLVAFGRDLRARGLPVGTGRILTFIRAVASLGLGDRDSLYWAGRVSLIASRADVEAYDEAFDAWYRTLGELPGRSVDLELPEVPQRAPSLDTDLVTEPRLTAGSWRSAADADEPEPSDETSIRIVASAVEVLRSKSFADLTEDERRRVARMIDPVVEAPALQRVVQLPGPVRRDDHGGRRQGADPPDLGDRHGELREDLQQERLELVVGAVELVHQEHRIAPRTDRRQEWPLDEELGTEQILDALLGVDGVHRADRDQLPGVVPFVQSLRGVDPLVALQADQITAQQLREHLRDLGLPDAGLALE